MRAYGILKNVKFPLSVDGIQFEVKEDLECGLRVGDGIYLDFSEIDYCPSGNRVGFRLKDASVQIETMADVSFDSDLVSDNNEELFEALKKCKLVDIVIYSEDVHCVVRDSKLSNFYLEVHDRRIHFKTNRTNVLN